MSFVHPEPGAMGGENVTLELCASPAGESPCETLAQNPGIGVREERYGETNPRRFSKKRLSLPEIYGHPGRTRLGGV